MSSKPQQQDQDQDESPQVQAPPPSWTECSIEQKIERLRLEAQNRRYQSELTARNLSHMRGQLSQYENHQHANDGTVLIRLANTGNSWSYGTAGQSVDSFDPLV